MTVAELIEHLDAVVVTAKHLDQEVKGCYVSDLLSDVLSSSETGQLWITQHIHPNVVAVASVQGISAILIVGGKDAAEDTISRAAGEDVNIISTGLTAFEAAGRVYSLLEKEGA